MTTHPEPITGKDAREPVMVHIGRKVPKGFEELPGSMHLGKGIWAFKMRPIQPSSPA